MKFSLNYPTYGNHLSIYADLKITKAHYTQNTEDLLIIKGDKKMRFHAPTRIIFGSGTISQLKEIVKKDLKASYLFLITDRGIFFNPLKTHITI